MQPLSFLDGAVIAATLVTTVLISHHFSARQQTSAKSQKKQQDGPQFWLVAISMASAFINAPTLNGFPNELYLHGPSFSLAQIIATILSWPIHSLLLLPIFRQLDGPAVLRYIEVRFSISMRRLLAFLFLLMNIVYQACALFLPSLALTTLIGLPKLISVLLVATSSALHALYGPNPTIMGAHWSNLFHAGIMCMLMGTIFAGGLARGGGIERVWRTNIEGGRLSWPNIFQLDHQTKHTAFNTVLGMTILRTFLHGINPGQVQSALSLENLRKSQLAQLIASLIFILTQLLATSIGLVMYSEFQGCDPLLDGQISRRETTLMYYLQTELTFVPAIRGIFLASNICSTLSSMSAFFSSSADSIYQELVAPILNRQQQDDCKKISQESGLGTSQIKKTIVLLLALTCSLATVLVVDRTNNLLQIIFTTFAIYSGPIVPCFLLGTGTRFVTSRGMFIGCIVSLALGGNIKYHQTFVTTPGKPTLPISLDTCQQVVSLSDSTDSPELNHDVAGLLQISYFWLPFFLALVASIVAILVSVIDQMIAKPVRSPIRSRMRVYTINPLQANELDKNKIQND